ncbi:MAG TPA: hypothetical protein VFU05_02265 [Cyclobacteriaceae bacterium]|nr:hypothetical protein [Cyclobacteriaceae bacterium]
MKDRNEKREVRKDSSKGMVSQKLHIAKQSIADFLNEKVNNLSESHKKISLLIFGSMLAAVCLLQLVQSVTSEKERIIISIDKITSPKDIYMNDSATQKLTPIGKMKGEIDGEFEAFYVAVDTEGQLFINRDPEFSKDSLSKTKGWEPITRQQLNAYEKQLHFIPAQKRGLKR